MKTNAVEPLGRRYCVDCGYFHVNMFFVLNDLFLKRRPSLLFSKLYIMKEILEER